MAVQTKTQMATELSTNFGNGGAATAAEFRAFSTDILDSYALSLAEADIIPNANNTFDLGSDAARMAQVHTQQLFVAGEEITAIADPASDSIAFFDLSAGGMAYLDTLTGLAISGTTLSVAGVLEDMNTLGPPTADGEFLVATGAGAFAYESGATARTSMGVAIGSDVQAYSATLDVYAANALTAGEIGQLQNIGTSTISAAQWGYLGATTAAGAALLDDADAAAQRTTLGAAALGANIFTGTQDFNGQQVEGMLNKVVASVTGTLTTTAHSGNVLLTTGNVTVPTTAGFNCVLVAGGAHTVTFNSTTSAAMATGDLMTIVVEDATTIHAVLTAAADKVSFT